MNQRINNYNSIKIFAIVQNACLGIFITGYTGAELSLATQQVICNLKAENIVGLNYFLTLTLIIGGFIGVLLYSYLHTFSTKRNIMILADLIFITAVTFQFDRWEAFLLQRFMKGISNGLNICAVLIYIKEVSPEGQSDTSVSIFQLNVNIGIVIANLISIPLSSQSESNQCDSSSYWQFLITFPLIIATIRMSVLIFIFNKDTPYSQYQQASLLQNQQNQNIQSQQMISSQQNIEQNQNESIRQITFSNHNLQDYNEIQLLNEDNNIQSNQNLNSLSELQIKNNQTYTQERLLNLGDRMIQRINYIQSDQIIQNYRKFPYYNEEDSPTFKIRCIHAMLACAAQQLSGINSIIQQQNESLLSVSKQDYLTNHILTVLMNLILLITAVITYKNVKRYKSSKYMMSIGCIILALLLLTIVIIPDELKNYKIIFVILYYIVFNSTLGPMILIYVVDIVKDKGITRAFYFYWLAYLIASGLQTTNCKYIPIIFATNCLTASYLSYKFQVQTHNISYFQLNFQFQKQNTYSYQSLLSNQY